VPRQVRQLCARPVDLVAVYELGEEHHDLSGTNSAGPVKNVGKATSSHSLRGDSGICVALIITLKETRGGNAFGRYAGYARRSERTGPLNSPPGIESIADFPRVETKPTFSSKQRLTTVKDSRATKVALTDRKCTFIRRTIKRTRVERASPQPYNYFLHAMCYNFLYLHTSKLHIYYRARLYI
jgi:hypothetical protein